MQAHFLCLAHNLMLLYESIIESVHGIRNVAELKRRAARQAKLIAEMAKKNITLSPLFMATQRLTQRSLKFIRWLRVQLFGHPPDGPPWDVLRTLFAHL